MRTLLFVATMLAVPTVASTDTLYKGNATPIYTCVGGDNSAAINALLANGGTVQIAAGTCLLSGGLHLTVSNTALIGAGAGLTILQAGAPLRMNIVEVGLAKNNYRGSGFTVANLTTDGALHVNANGVSKIGLGIWIHGGVTHSQVKNVETRFGLDGVNNMGSFNTIQANSHDNRHAGIYLGGNANLAPPYNYADSVIITGSNDYRNGLDNVVGKTWDDIDSDVLSSNVTITNNTVDGLDILISDAQTYGAISGVDIENNTVTHSSMGGIRLYGKVSNATVKGNILTSDGSGMRIMGPVTNALIQGNIFTQNTAAAVSIAPLSGINGDAITVDSNNILMPNNKPTVLVIGATNAHVTNNTYNGGHDSTAQAGVGLVDTGNY